MSVVFTLRHKMAAIAARYYDDVKWEPKVGDLYTIVRSDLDLFEIIYDDKTHLKFNRIFPTRWEFQDKWAKKGFTSESFGARRVWVPPWIVQDMKAQFNRQRRT